MRQGVDIRARSVMGKEVEEAKAEAEEVITSGNRRGKHNSLSRFEGQRCPPLQWSREGGKEHVTDP